MVKRIKPDNEEMSLFAVGYSSFKPTKICNNSLPGCLVQLLGQRVGSGIVSEDGL
jgi:hypothetical protein